MKRHFQRAHTHTHTHTKRDHTKKRRNVVGPVEISGQFVRSAYRCVDKKTCHVARETRCRWCAPKLGRQSMAVSRGGSAHRHTESEHGFESRPTRIRKTRMLAISVLHFTHLKYYAMVKKTKRQRAASRKERKRRGKINWRGMRKRKQRNELDSLYFLPIVLDTYAK